MKNGKSGNLKIFEETGNGFKLKKMETILKHKYSELDKKNQYFLQAATNAFESWIWFHLGKNLKKRPRIYPFLPRDAKVILTAKVNDARKRGEMIAKKIQTHNKKKIR